MEFGGYEYSGFALRDAEGDGRHGLASSSVATDGNRVCAIFATGDVVCADMDGKQLWAKNLGVPDNHYGFVSSLLIFGNTLSYNTIIIKIRN